MEKKKKAFLHKFSGQSLGEKKEKYQTSFKKCQTKLKTL